MKHIRIKANVLIDEFLENTDYKIEVYENDLKSLKEEYLQSIELQKWDDLTPEEVKYFSLYFENNIKNYSKPLLDFEDFPKVRLANAKVWSIEKYKIHLHVSTEEGFKFYTVKRKHFKDVQLFQMLQIEQSYFNCL